MLQDKKWLSPLILFVSIIVLGCLINLRFDTSNLLIIWMLIHAYWFSLFNRRLDIVGSVIFTVLLSFSLTTAAYAVAYFLHIAVLPYLIIVVHAILASAVTALGIYPRLKPSVPRYSDLPNIALLTSGVFLAAFLIRPFFIAPSTTVRVNRLSIGEDNISHFALHNSIYHNHSFAYDEKASGLINALKYYPQGLHAYYASNTSFLFGNDAPTAKVINSHILQISATYALFIVSLVYLGMRLAKKKLQPINTMLVAGVIPSLVVASGLGLLFYLFTYGFHTQIFTYYLLLVLPLVFLERFSDQEKYALLLLIILSICYTWFLVLPVMVGAALALLFVQKCEKPNHLLIAIGVAVAILSLLPIYEQQAFASGGSGIFTDGAVWRLQITNLLSVLLPALAVIVMFWKGREMTGKRIKPVAIILLLSIFGLLLIGALQYYEKNRLSYYFYKSEYMVYAFSFVLLIFIILSILSGVYGALKKSSMVWLPVTVIVVVGSLNYIFGFYSHNDYVQAYAHSNLLTYTDPTAINDALSKTPPKDILYPDTCESYSRYITMRWVGAILLKDNDRRHIYLTGMLDNIPNENSSYLKGSDALILNTPNCDKPQS